MTKVKLKDLVHSPITGEWGLEDENNDGVFVIRTTNFTKTGKIDFTNLAKRSIDKSKIDIKKLRAGDIIIEKSGGGPNSPVGRVVQFQPPDKSTYLCNNFTVALRPKKDVILPEYLFYQFSYLYQTGVVRKYQNQTIGLYNLKLERYLNVEVMVPSMAFQLKTIAQLNRIQILISKRKNNLDNIDKYLRAKFFELFGDPVLDTKDFGKKTLEYFGRWQTGGTPSRENDSFFDGNIPWYTSGELNQILAEQSNEFINAQAIESTGAKLIDAGSLLVGMYDTAALKSSITQFQSSCNQAIAFSKLNKERCDPIFLYYNIQYAREYLLNKRKGARQKNFNLTGIKNIQVIAPPVNLQKLFVNSFKICWSEKSKMKDSLEQFEIVFQLFLHNAFNNQIDEPDENEERFFDDILEGLTYDELLSKERLKHLVTWYDKANQKFKDFKKYDKGFRKKLLMVLENGEIEQVVSNGVIKLQLKS